MLLSPNGARGTQKTQGNPRFEDFTDFGSSGEISPSDATTKDTGSLRASSGVGLTWQSPFGPLGMDAGFPIVKEDFDITEVFRINFGTQF